MSETIILRACADGISPLFTSRYKNGDRPFYRYTDGGITITTAETDKNGSIASIELDETAGFVFGRNPSSQAIIGFGLGFIYDNPDDTNLIAHSSPFGIGSVYVKSPIAWQIDTVGDTKIVTSTNASFIAYDTGIDWPDDTYAYNSSIVNCTFTGDPATQAGQWKTYRLKQTDPDGGGHRNAHYTNKFHNQSFSALQLGMESDLVSGMNASLSPHPYANEGWSLHTMTSYTGTFNTRDGLIKAGKLLLDGASNYFQQGFSRADDVGVGTDTAVGVEVYSDAISERWRVSASQDYLVGGIDDGIPYRIDRTDFIFQIGSSARFMIANTDDPATMTEAYDLPIQIKSTTKAEFVLWKSRFANFTGKYLMYFDDGQNPSGGFIKSWPLVV